MMEIRLY
ncbi:UNVERIFIED_CONTAM: hypothetical protein GTU68_059038 [Idotea baltica]|nr:hypothetical protein [Idotea baltica]